MDEPKDSGSTVTANETATRTADEDAAVNASTDKASPLVSPVSPSSHETSLDLCRSKSPSNSINGHDGGTSEVEGICQSKEGLSAHVASPGLYESSLDAHIAPATETDAQGILGNSIIYSDVADSENGIDSSISSSPSIESSENSYTSLEPLVDEPRGRNNSRSSGSDCEGSDDAKYPKNIDKGKGKEVAPRSSEQGPDPPAERQQSLPQNNVPWVQDPERPPQKLPIRFTDCGGRNFVWPWKKAQTWKGAKGLIESAFLYVDVLGPHVFAGHYDLTIQGMWSDAKTAAINPTLASYPVATAQSSNSDNYIAGFGASSSAASSSFQHGPPPPSTKFSSHLLPKMPGYGAIILPELWEDVVEPGMLILMRMWPIAPSSSAHSHPPHMPVMPIPPPPPFHGVGVGRGRGRGAVSAQPLPPPPPGWQQPPGRRGQPLVTVPYRPPKGKTRKRQDGL